MNNQCLYTFPLPTTLADMVWDENVEACQGDYVLRKYFQTRSTQENRVVGAVESGTY